MPSARAHDETDINAERQRAARLKERVYVTFTALALVLALRLHEEAAAEALVTLAIGVLGTLLAVFVADVVSHVAVHAALPDARELRNFAQTSFGALGVLVLPLVFLVLAVASFWEADTALRASSFALVSALVVIAFLAVRRVRLPAWQKLVVLFAEFILGVLVIALEFVAHG